EGQAFATQWSSAQAEGLQMPVLCARRGLELIAPCVYLVGRLEQDIGEEIVSLEWRRQNLFTYELAKRAKQLHASIHAELNPPPPVPPHDPNWLRLEIPIDPNWVEPEPPSPQQLAARRRAADKQIELELGDAIALVKLGDIVTHEFLEKELAFRERLDAIITRLYKKLAYVRAIKSMSPAISAVPSLPLLESRPN